MSVTCNVSFCVLVRYFTFQPYQKIPFFTLHFSLIYIFSLLSTLIFLLTLLAFILPQQPFSFVSYLNPFTKLYENKKIRCIQRCPCCYLQLLHLRKNIVSAEILTPYFIKEVSMQVLRKSGLEFSYHMLCVYVQIALGFTF